MNLLKEEGPTAHGADTIILQAGLLLEASSSSTTCSRQRENSGLLGNLHAAPAAKLQDRFEEYLIDETDCKPLLFPEGKIHLNVAAFH